jgi:hypothetical protein
VLHNRKQIRTIGTLIVLVHLGVVLQHGSDHAHLAIDMAARQQAFIGIVIAVAPIVSAVMLWTRRWRAGLSLLAVSMAGSFLFGVWYHFLAAGSDNVFGMPSEGVHGAFRVTAVLLAIIEAAGWVWSLWALQSRSPERIEGAAKRFAA